MKEIAKAMHECTALLKRRFEQEARPHRLTMTQWKVLGMLGRHGTMRQVALGQALNASPMTISDVADRLEKAGLVTRTASPEDSRAKDMALTAEGETKFALMRRVSDAVFAEAFAGLSPDDLDHLRGTLARIMDNLSGETLVAMTDDER